MRRTLATFAVIFMLLGSASSAAAYGGYGDGYGDGSGGWGGGYGGRGGRAVSYINPDTGAATANPDVNAKSDSVSRAWAVRCWL